jgi:hypothetical protein
VRIEVPEDILNKGGLRLAFFSSCLYFQGGVSSPRFLTRYRIGTIRQKFSLATPAVSE